MITRIAINGFKSFTDFELDLEPITIVVGVNGVGKSNLFDAIRHLGRLVGGDANRVDSTLRAAFESERGSLTDLFTAYPDGTHATDMSFSVDLLLPPMATDRFGNTAELRHRRVTYSLELAMKVPGKLSLVSETLRTIHRKDDAFLKRYPAIRSQLPALKSGRGTAFIDTEPGQIVLRQDSRGGRKHPIPSEITKATAISGVTSVEYPHAFAAREVLSSVKFLQLSPTELRQPSAYSAPATIGAGGLGLPAALARLRQNHPEVLNEISDKLSEIVPGIARVYVVDDDTREEWTIAVDHVDGHRLPARLVSDGTLRLIALACLTHDPDFNGVIVLEEPENGIYAGRTNELLDLLLSLSGSDNRSTRRQLLANTHSIPLVEAIRSRKLTDSLMFAYLTRVVRTRFPEHRATTIAPVATDVNDGLFVEGHKRRRVVAIRELERLLKENMPEGAV